MQMELQRRVQKESRHLEQMRPQRIIQGNLYAITTDVQMESSEVDRRMREDKMHPKMQMITLLQKLGLEMRW